MNCPNGDLICDSTLCNREVGEYFAGSNINVWFHFLAGRGHYSAIGRLSRDVFF